MNNDTAANILRSHRWKLYTSEEMGLLPDGVLRRYIDNVQHQSIDTLVSFLERFGDVSNYDADATIAWSFVAGPWVDNTPRAGNWRLRRVSVEKVDAQGRVGSDGTNWRIVQELSEGFLTALDRDDARLVESRHMSGDTATNAGGEHYITLEWVGVDPDTMHALARKKVTTADVAKLWYRRQANDGLLKRVRLEGTWHHLASQSATAEDGSGTVRWLLADPEYVLTGYSDWLGARQTLRSYYWNVPEALAQGIMNAAKAKGVSASAMRYDAERGLIDLVIDALDLTGETIAGVNVGENCDATEYASFAFAGGNSAALPIPGSIPAGTSYDRNLTINGDGSYNIVLRWKVRKYRNITEYGAEFRADQDTARKEWKGVTTQDLSGDLIEIAGKVVRVQRNVREDCSVDVVRDTITPAKLETGFVEFDTPDGTAGVYAGQNLSIAEKDVIIGTIDGKAALNFNTSVSPRKNEFGLWDVTASYTPKRTSASVTSWGGQTDTVVLYPALTDNGRDYLAMVVFYYYNSTNGQAMDDLQATVAGGTTIDGITIPTGTYQNVPSYRGVASGANRVGVGRWLTIRVAVRTGAAS
jgi:hypothetical protein